MSKGRTKDVRDPALLCHAHRTNVMRGAYVIRGWCRSLQGSWRRCTTDTAEGPGAARGHANGAGTPVLFNSGAIPRALRPSNARHLITCTVPASTLRGRPQSHASGLPLSQRHTRSLADDLRLPLRHAGHHAP